MDFQVVVRGGVPHQLVTDEDVLTASTPAWPLRRSVERLLQRGIAELVDWWVREADPARGAQRPQRRRRPQCHDRPSRDRLTEFWGTLRTPDAAALDRRLNQLTATVCRGDHAPGSSAGPTRWRC